MCNARSGVGRRTRRLEPDARDAGDTILTALFDIAAGTPWPPGVAGRAIRDEFTDRWQGNEHELRSLLRDVPGIRSSLVDEVQRPRGMWAGEGVSTVTGREHAGDVVTLLVDAASAILAQYPAQVLRY